MRLFTEADKIEWIAYKIYCLSTVNTVYTFHVDKGYEIYQLVNKKQKCTSNIRRFPKRRVFNFAILKGEFAVIWRSQ